MDETHRIQTLLADQPKERVRFIKLGEGNAWASRAIESNLLVFGDPHISHEHALAGQWDEIRRQYKAAGARKDSFKHLANELKDFYEFGRNGDGLWITSHKGRIHWAFADGEVEYRAGEDMARTRRVLGWRSTTLDGRSELYVHQQTSALTKTFGFQGTICKVSGAEYLLRKILSAPDPVTQQAMAAEALLTRAVADLIARLHQDDFEHFSAKVAEALGWRIDTPVGGSQPHIDFGGSLPAAGLTGLFQVKSAAGAKELAAFIGSAEHRPSTERLIFICHSPRTRWPEQLPAHVEIWTRDMLADAAVRFGLHRWVMERT